MATDKDTVVALKIAFLNTQIRILSQRLEIPDHLRRSSEIPAATIDEVMKEVNRLLRRHNKSVYDSLAVRSVAEQVDSLYWEAGAPENDAAEHDGTPRTLDDLTDDFVIANLPPDFSNSREYADGLNRLQALSARRAELQKKLASFTGLQSMLQPLRNPQDGLQKNLVTRDGALVDELSKTKSLSMRLGGRLAGSQNISLVRDGSVMLDVQDSSKRIQQALAGD